MKQIKKREISVSPSSCNVSPLYTHLSTSIFFCSSLFYLSFNSTYLLSSSWFPLLSFLFQGSCLATWGKPWRVQFTTLRPAALDLTAQDGKWMYKSIRKLPTFDDECRNGIILNMDCYVNIVDEQNKKTEVSLFMINVPNWTTWGKDDALFCVLYIYICEYTRTTCVAIPKSSIILSSTGSGTMNPFLSVRCSREWIMYRLTPSKATLLVS
jgi:hypothetical protein